MPLKLSGGYITTKYWSAREEEKSVRYLQKATARIYRIFM